MFNKNPEIPLIRTADTNCADCGKGAGDVSGLDEAADGMVLEFLVRVSHLHGFIQFRRDG